MVAYNLNQFILENNLFDNKNTLKLSKLKSFFPINLISYKHPIEIRIASSFSLIFHQIKRILNYNLFDCFEFDTFVCIPRPN